MISPFDPVITVSDLGGFPRVCLFGPSLKNRVARGRALTTRRLPTKPAAGSNMPFHP